MPTQPALLSQITAVLLGGASLALGVEPVTTQLTAQPGEWSESVVDGISAYAKSFVIEAQMDPLEAEGGDIEPGLCSRIGKRRGASLDLLEDGVHPWAFLAWQ